MDSVILLHGVVVVELKPVVMMPPSARSQWNYYVKSTKKNGHHQWQCKYCTMN